MWFSVVWLRGLEPGNTWPRPWLPIINSWLHDTSGEGGKALPPRHLASSAIRPCSPGITSLQDVCGESENTGHGNRGAQVREEPLRTAPRHKASYTSQAIWPARAITTICRCSTMLKTEIWGKAACFLLPCSSPLSMFFLACSFSLQSQTDGWEQMLALLPPETRLSPLWDEVTDMKQGGVWFHIAPRPSGSRASERKPFSIANILKCLVLPWNAIQRLCNCPTQIRKIWVAL